MTNHLNCPLGDASRCELAASLELSGGRGIVQSNCRTCGHGQAIELSAVEALALHDELHRHVSPPAALPLAGPEPSPESE